jgi:tetratricopeptide (TPR) repeat protein
VTDFGLARARARVISAETGNSVLVTSGGMTPAYCSPEQARGEAVSRRTDVWSWGVLVLETFLGRSPCCERGGVLAPGVLARYLESPHEGPIDRMPADVAELLRLCFVADPAGRWQSLGEAAEALEAAYRTEVGHDYPRPAPEAEAAPSGGRPGSSSGGYESPRKWLALAYRAAGRDPTEADDRLPPPALTRRAQIVADLTAFDEAAELLRRADWSGQELRPLLAGLEVQKALAHAAACDYGAAIDGLTRAATAWHELVYGFNRREFLPGLIQVWLHSSFVHRHRGDYDCAIESCDRVIRLWERLDNRRARRDLRDDLATACLEKGLALRGRGDVAGSLPPLDRAIDLWRTMVEDEGQEGPAGDLAQALLSKSSVLAERGRTDEALELCDEAIEIRRRLARRRAELAGDLARAYVRKGNVLRTRDETSPAMPLYQQAILLLERRLDEMDRDDLAPDLARAYLALGNAERRRGDFERAVGSCASAVSIYERLVQREGRRELTGELARAYVHQGVAVRMAGDVFLALTWCERGIELLRRLVEDEERTDWVGDLARAYVSKANALREHDRHREALELYDRVIALRRSLPAGRDEVAADLARDRVGRGEVLLEMGERESAKEELARAESELASAYQRTPRHDLLGVLNKARRLLRELA